MKKTFITLFVLCVLASSAQAVEPAKNNPQFHKCPPTKEQLERNHRAHEAAFEQRLGLTEVQKMKARNMRKQNFEKIKPVIDEIQIKKQEAEMIRNSKLSPEAQEEKLAVIDKEITELNKQAKEIRKQNMKDFESILTAKQKKTLKQMKNEGRKNFEERHHQVPPPPIK